MIVLVHLISEGPRPMAFKIWRGGSILSAWLLVCPCLHAQLRPQVTPPATNPGAPKPAQIVIQTSPNAEVYLDDTFKGKTSPQGRLVIDNPRPGEHALRISLAGKTDWEQKLRIVAGQETTVPARLKEAAPNGLVTGESDELLALAREVPGRDFFKISLPALHSRQTVGTVTLELAGSDPQRGVYTIYLECDNKRMERANKAVNEPWYFYLQGTPSAIEVVVSKLGKDAISGYLSTPKGVFASAPTRPMPIVGNPSSPEHGANLGPGDSADTTAGVFNVGGSVSPPVPIYKPDPQFTEDARKSKCQGNVVLSIIIDTSGAVTDCEVVKSIGCGLDEKAVETVRRWKFKPAQRNGAPVPVRLMVQVSFVRF